MITVNELPYIYYPFDDNLGYRFTLSGTYDGSPTNFRVLIFNASGGATLISYADLENQSISGGVWSGEVYISRQNAMFRFTVQRSDNSETASTNNQTTVAFIGVIFGQSNAQYFHNVGTATPHELVKFTENGVTIDQTGGFGITTLGNKLREELQCSVLLLKWGYGGYGLAVEWSFGPFGCWLNCPVYDNMMNAINNVGGAIHAFFWHQGETDAMFGCPYNIYRDNETELIEDIRRDVANPRSGDLPFISAYLGNYDDSANGMRYVDSWPGIKQGKYEVFRDVNNVYIIGCNGLEMQDTIHYRATTGGYGVMALRWAQCILYHFGLTSYFRGPVCVSIEQLTTTTTNIRLRLNSAASAITPTTNIDSFQVLLNSVWTNCTGALDSYSGQYADVVLTHASGTVTDVKCLCGDETDPPTTYMIKDNSPLTLQIEPMVSVVTYGEEILSSGWSINISSSGVAECGGYNNTYIEPAISVAPTLTTGSTYRFFYEIKNFTSGSLYITGFCTKTILSNLIDSHFVDVYCSDGEQPLRVVTDTNNGWTGQLDNLNMVELVT